MSIFGAKVAVVYVVIGLVIAVVGGTVIEKMHMENHVEEFIRNEGSVDIESEELAVKDRLVFASYITPTAVIKQINLLEDS